MSFRNVNEFELEHALKSVLFICMYMWHIMAWFGSSLLQFFLLMWIVFRAWATIVCKTLVLPLQRPYNEYEKKRFLSRCVIDATNTHIHFSFSMERIKLKVNGVWTMNGMKIARMNATSTAKNQCPKKIGENWKLRKLCK